MTRGRLIVAVTRIWSTRHRSLATTKPGGYSKGDGGNRGEFARMGKEGSISPAPQKQHTGEAIKSIYKLVLHKFV